MKAALLAGGKGTRLRPITLSVPKSLLPVALLPILRHQVERVRAAGIREIAACMGDGPFPGWEEFLAGLPDDVEVKAFWEKEPLGTGGALRALVDWLDGERLFALNADDITDIDPAALADAHESLGARATLGLCRVAEEGELSADDADPATYGNVRLGDDGRIQAFLEKPEAGDFTGLINAGQYVLDAEALQRFPAGHNLSIEREGFPQLLAEGVAVCGVALDSYHRPVNTPAQYLQVHADLYEGRWRPPWLEGAAGHNQIGPNCTIYPDAALGANVTLGEGCEVGSGAVLEEAILLPGVRVGPHARVKRSVLGAETRVGHHAGVERTVLGRGTLVPPWASLGLLEPGRRGMRAT